ncbi:MAG: hypothetical protein ACRDZ5_03335 [Acidimicrobiales bacterium]
MGASADPAAHGGSDAIQDASRLEAKESLAAVAPRARRTAALAEASSTDSRAGRLHGRGGEATESGRRLMVFLIVIVVGAGLLALMYAASVHADAGDSDGAAVILQGQAMSKGHLLLSGWSLSLDSFWTVDAPFYLVAVLLGGVTPVLLHLVPAVIALLVIGAGAYIAAEGRRGPGAVVGALTVVALLGFPTHTMAYFFLRGPLHVATALWCLVAFIAVRRGRFDFGFAVAVIFLAAGVLGDLQALAYGVIPLFLAGLVAMCRCRSLRGGLAQSGAAVGGVVVAYVVRKIAKAAGSFGIGTANPRAGLSAVPRNIHHAITETAQLIGVSSRDFGTGGTPRALEDLHVIALAVLVIAGVLAIVALVAGVVRGAGTLAGWPMRHVWSAPRPPYPRSHPRGKHSAAGERAIAEERSPTASDWRLDDVLTIACLAPAGTYVILAVTPDIQYGRYLTAGVIFGAILAGRILARFASSINWRRSLGIAAGAIGLAIAVAFGAGTGYTVSGRAPVQSAANLSAFLEAHHLDLGVSDYWSSNITTVVSHGRVELRAVVSAAGRLQRYNRLSPGSWYAKEPFGFLVYNLGLPWGGVNMSSAVATWGPPAHEYAVGTYRVLVWDHTLTVNPHPPAR